MSTCYEMVREFKKKYPLTISFRLKKHCKLVDEFLNDGEKIIFAFPAQKNGSVIDIFYTNVVALTNKRIIIATKRLFWGYLFLTITPDMYNDLTVRKKLIFGSILIDTIKENVVLSNIDPRALPEIEEVISEYMMEKKKEYARREKKER